MSPEYAIGKRYPDPAEEPPTDDIALFLEGIPVFKIWYSAPLEFEAGCLDGICSHIGFLPPPHVPGGLPFFVFTNSAEQTFFVKAPLVATQEQVEQWSRKDSNIVVMFVLIERGTQMIRQIRTLGMQSDFQQILRQAWKVSSHPVDMRQAQSVLSTMNTTEIFRKAKVWKYNAEKDIFEPHFKPAVRRGRSQTLDTRLR